MAHSGPALAESASGPVARNMPLLNALAPRLLQRARCTAEAVAAARRAYALSDDAPVDYTVSMLGRFDPALIAHPPGS